MQCPAGLLRCILALESWGVATGLSFFDEKSALTYERSILGPVPGTPFIKAYRGGNGC